MAASESLVSVVLFLSYI